ncbi:MAG: hypothetical protein KDE31_23570, partial [Caldilineaceae bacterium]|nr:hypothetical protein [Caldilineaceae bacterium]
CTLSCLLINRSVAAHNHSILLLSTRVAACGYGATTDLAILSSKLPCSTSLNTTFAVLYLPWRQRIDGSAPKFCYCTCIGLPAIAAGK